MKRERLRWGSGSEWLFSFMYFNTYLKHQILISLLSFYFHVLPQNQFQTLDACEGGRKKERKFGHEEKETYCYEGQDLLPFTIPSPFLSFSLFILSNCSFSLSLYSSPSHTLSISFWVDFMLRLFESESPCLSPSNQWPKNLRSLFCVTFPHLNDPMSRVMRWTHNYGREWVREGGRRWTWWTRESRRLKEKISRTRVNALHFFSSYCYFDHFPIDTSIHSCVHWSSYCKL